MPLFETYSQEIDLSQLEAKMRLKDILLEQPYLQWSKSQRLKFFKGRLEQNRFSIKSVYLNETILLKGKIEIVDTDNCHIQILGKIAWYHLVRNLLIFVSVVFSLGLLSILMFAENSLYGLGAIVLTTAISIGLYFNLIGRMKRKHKILSEAIINRLARN